MQIFIAGCGRSGTTLTRNLLRCFDDVTVYPGEADVSQFELMAEASGHLVVKRRWDSYLKLPRLPLDVRLIYCVRHPFDVLTSSNPATAHLRTYHITIERWQAEFEALRELRLKQPHRPIYYCRYEDLVRVPDEMQVRLVHHFGLRPHTRFSKAPGNVPHLNSLRKWERNETYRGYLAQLSTGFRSQLRSFCDMFDYDWVDLNHTVA